MLDIRPTNHRLAPIAVLHLAITLGACAPSDARLGGPGAGSTSAVTTASPPIPSEFISKLYSEALGRASDLGGWATWSSYAQQHGCNAPTLTFVAQQFFGSEGYRTAGYSPEESVLTIYRALLSREPDPQGFANWVRALRDGLSTVDVVEAFGDSAEFAALVPGLCSGTGYRRDWGGTRAIDIGGGVMSESALQDCLTNNTVCELDQDTVVHVTGMVSIPAGHELRTRGLPGPHAYAKQARLVRDVASGIVPDDVPGTMILLGAGASVQSIWVDGGRARFETCHEAGCDGVSANFIYWGGDGAASIVGCRSDSPLRRTHLAAMGVRGTILIRDNLLTGYANRHTSDFWDVSDGMSVHHPAATIVGNDIIDATDVSLIIFGVDRGIQGSEAYANIVQQAGNSVNAAFALWSPGCTSGRCTFSGPGIHDNTIIASVTQHIDIPIVLGAGAWNQWRDHVPTVDCDAPDGSSQCGIGGHITDNVTSWDDPNQKLQSQIPVLVDGMIDANIDGNRLFTTVTGGIGNGACYAASGGRLLVTHRSAGGQIHASATTPGEDVAVHDCLPHP